MIAQQNVLGRKETVSKSNETLPKSEQTSSRSENALTKVAVVGGTGYAGQELIKLLSMHPHVELTAIGSNSHDGEIFSDVHPGFSGIVDKICGDLNVEELAADNEVVFLALPHGAAAKSITQDILDQTIVIDLSGDFRLSNSTNHMQSKPAVYGLCEFNKSEIARATFIANPGCYATAAILSLVPLVKAGLIAEDSIIIDGKSGVSGAGRTASLPLHFGECNESMKAYQLPQHRHTPEIEQILARYTANEVVTTFAAHLVPMNRGILLTAYAELNYPTSYEGIISAYNACYKSEPFVRLMESRSVMPETRWVKGSNYCDIGFAIDERSNRIVTVAAIDNLIKGAAGQAIQNMNIILGLDETTGLKQIPSFL